MHRRAAVTASVMVMTVGAAFTGLSHGLEAAFLAQTSAAATFSVAPAVSGSLWAWGSNATAQLGDGSTTTRLVPTQVGSATTWKTLAMGSTAACGVRTSGSLWCWGSNTYAATGLGTTSGNTTTPTLVDASTWSTVSVGDQFGCGIQTTGTLYCWGYHGPGSGDGRLGQGGISNDVVHPQQVGAAGVVWRSVSAGFTTACAIRTDNTLWCWGGNADGQVGDGTTTQRQQPVQVAAAAGGVWASVVAGERHTCAVRSDATLYCWGYNGQGALGLGTTTSWTTPQQVAAGAGGVWSQISAGRQHTCGLRTDGTLWCWGANTNGRLGDGTSTERDAPVQVGSSLWTALASGSDHSCALLMDNSLWCWGVGTSGQLGTNSTSSVSVPTRVVDAGAATKSAMAVAAGSAAAGTLAVGVW